ncbi:MAG: stage 0 sporulation family protein [Flavobacteriales bacterium]
MGCSSCGSGGGLPGGCKNNGNCGTSGCNKLDVFDWLSGVELAPGQKKYDIAEVRFKGTRKAFFRNSAGLDLQIGDVIAVESSPGYDVGVVSLTGELVKVQMKKKKVQDTIELKKILRKVTPEDVEKWQEARQLEHDTMHKARVLAKEAGLTMKISDVEYQGDKKKATFFYTADDRVDFRELIRKMADLFKTRIEMRQIGSRQESARLGGIGSCGRELCCSTWLTDFRSVSTSAARYQQLSLNPQKLAGQCGKLKCCLNYELDMYMEAVKEFPDPKVKLHTKKGVAYHLKTDIFKRLVYYVYDDGMVGGAPVALDVETVNEIIAANKAGDKYDDLKEFEVEVDPVVEDTDYLNVVGQDSLTRFDTRKKKRPNKRRNKRKPNTNAGSSGAQNRKSGEDPNRPKRKPNRKPKRTNTQNKQGANSNGPKKEGGKPNTGNSKPQNSGGGAANSSKPKRRPPRKPRPPKKD